MVYEGQEKSRCVLDDALLTAKLIFFDHMSELDRRVLLGARWVVKGYVHHLPRREVIVLVRVAGESWPYRCITAEKEDTLLING